MADDHEKHQPFKWRKDEVAALLLPIVALGILIGATVAFGFAGLISVALVLVAASMAALVIISFG